MAAPASHGRVGREGKLSPLPEGAQVSLVFARLFASNGASPILSEHATPVAEFDLNAALTATRV